MWYNILPYQNVPASKSSFQIRISMDASLNFTTNQRVPKNIQTSIAPGDKSDNEAKRKACVDFIYVSNKRTG